MTAPNNPTPEVELVERLLEPWDQRQSRRVQIEAEASAYIKQLIAERDAAREGAQKSEDRANKETIDYVRLHDQTSDAISRLTAERDVQDKMYRLCLQDNIRLAKERDERTEANKLLSERVVVLESDLKHVRSMAGKSRGELEAALEAALRGKNG